MKNYISTALLVFGLILTCVGAGIAAYNVIMTKDHATELASTKWSLNATLRKDLIDQSRSTRNGLLLVAAGTVFQIAGTIGAALTGTVRKR
jgi:hypothetical protein